MIDTVKFGRMYLPWWSAEILSIKHWAELDGILKKNLTSSAWTCIRQARIAVRAIIDFMFFNFL